MCLSGDPFVPKMGTVRAEESCGFELEKRPPDPRVSAVSGQELMAASSPIAALGVSPCDFDAILQPFRRKFLFLIDS